MWDVLIQNLPVVLLSLFAFIICGAELIKASRVWKEERQKKVNQVVEERQKECDLQEEFNKIHEALNQLNARFDTLETRLEDMEARLSEAEVKLENLIVSDMHDIKSWIVEQYHKFFVQQGWIDAFSRDTIERRFADYEQEGGNSYIRDLMSKIRSLPMDPENR